MNKILIFGIIGVLLISGFGTASLQNRINIYDNLINVIKFENEPILSNNGDYFNIEFEGSNSYINEPGNPVLPKYRRIFEFSKDVKINNLIFSYNDIFENNIIGKITPAAQSIPLNEELSENHDLLSKLDENQEKILETYGEEYQPSDVEIFSNPRVGAKKYLFASLMSAFSIYVKYF